MRAPDRDVSLAVSSRLNADDGVVGARKNRAGDDGDEMDGRRPAVADLAEAPPAALPRDERVFPDGAALALLLSLLAFAFAAFAAFAAFSRASAASAVSTTAHSKRYEAPGTLDGGFRRYKTAASARDRRDSGVGGGATGDGVLDAADTSRDTDRSDKRGTSGAGRASSAVAGVGVMSLPPMNESAAPRDVFHSSPNASAYAATRCSSATPSNASSG